MKALAALATVAAASCSSGGPMGSAPLPADAPRVVIATSRGDIVIGLYEDQAPISVANFLDYVDAGFYDGTLFHRAIPDFMIQGGGYDREGGGPLRERRTRPPIANESSNGLRNLRGTLSMARRSDPDSATSQFFINLADNQSLDPLGEVQLGYTVFGVVTEGLEVAEAIAAVDKHQEAPVPEPAVPDEDVIIRSVRRLQ